MAFLILVIQTDFSIIIRVQREANLWRLPRQMLLIFNWGFDHLDREKYKTKGDQWYVKRTNFKTYWYCAIVENQSFKGDLRLRT